MSLSSSRSISSCFRLVPPWHKDWHSRGHNLIEETGVNERDVDENAKDCDEDETILPIYVHHVAVYVCVSFVGSTRCDSVAEKYTARESIQTMGKKGLRHVPIASIEQRVRWQHQCLSKHTAIFFLPRNKSLLGVIPTCHFTFFFVPMANEYSSFLLYANIFMCVEIDTSDSLEGLLLVTIASRVDSQFAFGFFWGNLVSPPLDAEITQFARHDKAPLRANLTSNL